MHGILLSLHNVSDHACNQDMLDEPCMQVLDKSGRIVYMQFSDGIHNRLSIKLTSLHINYAISNKSDVTGVI